MNIYKITCNYLASTVIVDIDTMLSRLNNILTMLGIFTASNVNIIYNKFNYNYDSREALLEVRVSTPWVMWIGDTDGGDVGASLHIHYDNDGFIDSLIV